MSARARCRTASQQITMPAAISRTVGKHAVLRMRDALEAVEQQGKPERRQEEARPVERLGLGLAVAGNEARDQRQPDQRQAGC